MRFDFALALDVLSPLALIALLSWSYGLIRHRFAGAAVAPVLMGVMFGIVAAIQMRTPLEPVAGLIVDLRTIPVALAGAYLGRRGLAACGIVALSARHDIGGVGMAADIVGIVVAGFAGLAWDRATRAQIPRGFRHLLALGVAMSTALLTGLMLPAPLRGWFVGSAVPVLLPLNLFLVPALAVLLERERALLLLEVSLAAGAHPDAQGGMLTRRGFAQALAERVAGPNATEPPRAILLVEIRLHHWLTAHWAAAITGHILGGLRPAIRELVRHGDLIGAPGPGRLVVALSTAEVRRAGRLSEAFRHAVAERAISLPDGDAARVSVVFRLVPLGGAVTADEIDARLEAAGPARRSAMQVARRAKTPVRSDPLARSHPALFAKSSELLARRGL